MSKDRVRRLGRTAGSANESPGVLLARGRSGANDGGGVGAERLGNARTDRAGADQGPAASAGASWHRPRKSSTSLRRDPLRRGDGRAGRTSWPMTCASSKSNGVVSGWA